MRQTSRKNVASVWPVFERPGGDLAVFVPQLRLNQEQRQQKEAAEAAVADLEEQAALEADPDVKAGLEEQIAAGKASLDDLMEAFAVRAFHALECHHWHTQRFVAAGGGLAVTLMSC